MRACVHVCVFSLVLPHPLPFLFLMLHTLAHNAFHAYRATARLTLQAQLPWFQSLLFCCFYNTREERSIVGRLCLALLRHVSAERLLGNTGSVCAVRWGAMLRPASQDCSSTLFCFGCWTGRMVGFNLITCMLTECIHFPFATVPLK